LTTPTPGPTLSLATDKTTYDVGDTIVVTATYSDGSTSVVSLTVTATATDASGQAVSADTTVSVNQTTQEVMAVTVTDSFGDTYAEQDGSPIGTAVFTAMIGTPPAA
jgi:hypothetical protein